jgi:head-tail adaptor
MSPIAAGELRHRVTLHAPEGTRDEGSPADLATGIPAKILAVPLQFQQAERLAAGGVRMQTLYTITMRYREDVAEDLQLVEECCTERTFHILSMIPDDQLTTLELTCVVGPRAAS